MSTAACSTWNSNPLNKLHSGHSKVHGSINLGLTRLAENMSWNKCPVLFNPFISELLMTALNSGKERYRQHILF